jgi:hypothetical protein
MVSKVLKNAGNVSCGGSKIFFTLAARPTREPLNLTTGESWISQCSSNPNFPKQRGKIDELRISGRSELAASRRLRQPSW